jgi:Aldose 1-epimerase
MKNIFVQICFLAALFSCTSKPKDVYSDSYQLKNKNGVIVRVSSYGGRIMSLSVPDKNGKLISVVLGFDSVDQ